MPDVFSNRGTRAIYGENIWEGPKTVGELIDILLGFPREWRVKAELKGLGAIAVEHREIRGKPIAAIFGKHTGLFGENPLTEEEYSKKSQQFLADIRSGWHYTSTHGDHRTYSPKLGENATCYGTHYDHRVIARMVEEGLIAADSVDLERVSYQEAADELEDLE